MILLFPLLYTLGINYVIPMWIIMAQLSRQKFDVFIMN